ncbi:MAG: hypothetical protein WBO09_11475 [Methylocystis silviterrae]|uniref:hypothetical protein n=1 Tax=Methylocystis silviterrae TaxID=2743612 RepID=UPI003C764500
MSLSDGDPAPDGDIWFRIVTHEKQIKRGGPHHSAWAGAIRPPKAGKNRPWARELSGRLRSLAGSLDDIARHGEAFCEEQTALKQGTKTFNGVIYARVRDIRQWEFENSLRTNVHFTPHKPPPKPVDEAHADLTFDRWLENETDEEKERFNLWLSGRVEALYAVQLHYLPEAEVAPQRPESWLRNIVTQVRSCFGLQSVKR